MGRAQSRPIFLGPPGDAPTPFPSASSGVIIPAMTDPDIRAAAIRLHDRFTHDGGDRRAFMADMAKLAGGMAAAQLLLAGIAANPAAAAIVDPQDPDIAARRVQWNVAGGRVLKGYLVTPRHMTDRLPAVMVIHENRGLNAHIEDVTRRMARDGFIAVAPDFLTISGGTPADEDAARAAIGQLNPGQTIADAVATLDWLRRMPRANGKVGAVGFCWGGGLVNRLAIAAGPRLDAGVPYYGPPGDPAAATRVKAAMLMHYAGEDPRVNQNADAWVQALKAAGVKAEAHMYEGTQHAFNNDSSVERYDPVAARVAWSRTVAFLHAELATAPE